MTISRANSKPIAGTIALLMGRFNIIPLEILKS
jgi:hypothetical protein